ncbi:MAG: peptidoglycan editing factor PgeF [Nitrospirae bacterium]|nr:peptidoglycan editing factor PgeF [Nitrospirota bacterium]
MKKEGVPRENAETIIVPEIFGTRVKAFFTGRAPGIALSKIARIASVAKDRIYLPVQKHTDKVLLLDSAGPEVGDAVITDRKGMLLGVQSADCVPVLLYDRKRQVAGVAHAGWRGTAAGIVRKTVREMIRRFSSSPSDIQIAIGPAIRWCSYEVGYEVVEAVRKMTGEGDYSVKKGEKYYLDLPRANRLQALSGGVLPRNIWMTEDCTFCLPGKYYSYRFAGGPTGRQGGFIGIV